MHPGDVPFSWKVALKEVPVDITHSEISAPVLDDGVEVGWLTVEDRSREWTGEAHVHRGAPGDQNGARMTNWKAGAQRARSMAQKLMAHFVARASALF